jgi:hypothetical protein
MRIFVDPTFSGGTRLPELMMPIAGVRTPRTSEDFSAAAVILHAWDFP